MKAGIILQARLASSRLPGKALASINSQTLVEHCLKRLQASGVGQVVLATTTRPEDAALCLVAERNRVPVYRGPVQDVLQRFVDAAAHFELDVIVRATADNPAVDIDAPARVIKALAKPGVDYVRESGLPYGTDVEAITRRALTRAASLAETAEDREHVTTFIRRHPELFKVVQLSAPAAITCPDLRLTVDTRDDLLFVREVFRRAAVDTPPLATLIAAAGTFARSEVA